MTQHNSTKSSPNHDDAPNVSERHLMAHISHTHFSMTDVAPSRYFLWVAALLGVLFSLISAETRVPYGVHLLHWLFQTLVPMLFMIFSYKAIVTGRWRYLRSPWLRLGLAGFIGASVFVPFALCSDLLVENIPWPTQLNDWMSLLLDEAAGVMPPVIICWLAINTPWVMGFQLLPPSSTTNPSLVSNQHQVTTQPDAQYQPHNPVRQNVVLENVAMTRGSAELASSEHGKGAEHIFWAQLPTGIGRDILYLKSELHYLLVVTRQGRSLILCNLRDAMEACHHLPGLQPHRSYWVNQTAIQTLKKQGRVGVLHLCNGAEIPVSRNHLKYVAQTVSKAITEPQPPM
jgi:hypothetical protein